MPRSPVCLSRIRASNWPVCASRRSITSVILPAYIGQVIIVPGGVFMYTFARAELMRSVSG
jgi:hypothetical protein